MRKLYIPILYMTALIMMPLTAQADYLYTGALDQEFQMVLPEAPTGTTIWADGTPDRIPLLDTPPRAGDIGEIATLHLANNASAKGDFKLKIITIQADKTFLDSLDEMKMAAEVLKPYDGKVLGNKSLSYIPLENGMKISSLTGYEIDDDSNVIFHSSQYMTGTHSVMLIRASYDSENQAFDTAYKKLSESIRLKP